jgi:hypothetical protein
MIAIIENRGSEWNAAKKKLFRRVLWAWARRGVVIRVACANMRSTLRTARAA